MEFISISLEVPFYVLDDRKGLFVGDHALVRALHFVHRYDVDVCARTLFEAGADRQSVEEVCVQSSFGLGDEVGVDVAHYFS